MTNSQKIIKKYCEELLVSNGFTKIKYPGKEAFRKLIPENKVILSLYYRVSAPNDDKIFLHRIEPYISFTDLSKIIGKLLNEASIGLMQKVDVKTFIRIGYHDFKRFEELKDIEFEQQLQFDNVTECKLEFSRQFDIISKRIVSQSENFQDILIKRLDVEKEEEYFELIGSYSTYLKLYFLKLRGLPHESYLKKSK